MAEQKRISKSGTRKAIRGATPTRKAGMLGIRSTSAYTPSYGYGRDVDAAVRDSYRANEW